MRHPPRVEVSRLTGGTAGCTGLPPGPGHQGGVGCPARHEQVRGWSTSAMPRSPRTSIQASCTVGTPITPPRAAQFPGQGHQGRIQDFGRGRGRPVFQHPRFRAAGPSGPPVLEPADRHQPHVLAGRGHRAGSSFLTFPFQGSWNGRLFACPSSGPPHGPSASWRPGLDKGVHVRALTIQSRWPPGIRVAGRPPSLAARFRVALDSPDRAAASAKVRTRVPVLFIFVSPSPNVTPRGTWRQSVSPAVRRHGLQTVCLDFLPGIRRFVPLFSTSPYAAVQPCGG